MIFVSVGSVFGFDRLIHAMDRWAERRPDIEVYGQIGDGKYEPAHMQWARILSGIDYRKAVESAELMVAHAGMGSYFAAMEARKPIIMMPRLAGRREHTSDHQVHTLRWLQHKSGVFAANSEDELEQALSAAMQRSIAIEGLATSAPAPFLERLRDAVLH